jgi:hypothetical protein
LTDLSVGNHNLIVYAQDEAGNLGTSQTSFTVVEQLNQLEQAAEQQPKPFPAALTAKALLLTLGVVLATLIYFRLYRKSS